MISLPFEESCLCRQCPWEWYFLPWKKRGLFAYTERVVLLPLLVAKKPQQQFRTNTTSMNKSSSGIMVSGKFLVLVPALTKVNRNHEGRYDTDALSGFLESLFKEDIIWLPTVLDFERRNADLHSLLGMPSILTKHDGTPVSFRFDICLLRDISPLWSAIESSRCWKVPVVRHDYVNPKHVLGLCLWSDRPNSLIEHRISLLVGMENKRLCITCE